MFSGTHRRRYHDCVLFSSFSLYLTSFILISLNLFHYLYPQFLSLSQPHEEFIPYSQLFPLPIVETREILHLDKALLP